MLTRPQVCWAVGIAKVPLITADPPIWRLLAVSVLAARALRQG